MKIFLLAGQSNMQGFGMVGEGPMLFDERIFNLATGSAMPAVEPLHDWPEHRMPEGIGIGLAMPFALEILKVYPNLEIGFVPTAKGGSHLNEWLPGKTNFERAVALFERANAHCSGLELAGLLWHQGCADSRCLEDASTYGRRLEQTLLGFRERLGVSDLPVIAGELGRSVTLDGRDTVVAQTRSVIEAIGHAAFVTSENLDCANLHFTTPAIRELGLRYADAYLQIGAEWLANGQSSEAI